MIQPARRVKLVAVVTNETQMTETETETEKRIKRAIAREKANPSPPDKPLIQFYPELDDELRKVDLNPETFQDEDDGLATPVNVLPWKTARERFTLDLPRQ